MDIFIKTGIDIFIYLFGHTLPQYLYSSLSFVTNSSFLILLQIVFASNLLQNNVICLVEKHVYGKQVCLFRTLFQITIIPLTKSLYFQNEAQVTLK